MNTKTENVTITTNTENVQNKYINELSKMNTTSEKIRFLDSNNVSRMNISKILNIRYQHVRNVLITPVTNPKVTKIN